MVTADPPAHQYWDSGLFISYLRDRADESQTVQTVADLLRYAEGGHMEIVISAFVMAEVRPYSDRYDESHMKIIEDLFATNRPFLRVVAVTGAVARRAREIGAEHRQLTVADAIHVATAVQEGVDVMFTLDGVRAQGQKRSGDLTSYDRKIGDPPLEIREPRWSYGALFD